ncbi:MAG: hypothetical protein WB870_02225 [Gallionellaceae bacterium]
MIFGNEFLNHTCAMHWMAIYNEKNWSGSIDEQSLHKFDEQGGVEFSFMAHEPQFASRAYRRNHVQGMLRAGSLDHWSLPALNSTGSIHTLCHI